MNKSTRSWLIAILVLSVLLRAGVALYLGDSVPIGKDEYSYSELAGRLATCHGYSFDQGWYPFTPADTPTAHWSFLYAAFVAAVYAIAGPHPLAARLVQAVLVGLLMPWLTYRLARRVMGRGGGRERGRGGEGEHPASIPLLAAFLSAIYAYFVLYGAMVQTEAFYICALLWSLERALAFGGQRAEGRGQGSGGGWGMAVLLGLSLGVATLLRQSILPWAVVAFGWLAWGAVGEPGDWKSRQPLQSRPAPTGSQSTKVDFARVAAVLTAGLVLVACIAPFTIRNYLAYDNFLLLNSNAGYAMYSAQHPMHGTSFQEFTAAPLPEDIDSAAMNEATWDKELMRRGIGFVLAEPGRYLLLCLSRVRDYVEFWPTADSSLLFNLGRVASIGLFLPFMLYGVWVALRHSTFNFQHSTFLILFVAFYSALHIATWAMSRYRLPVDAVLLVFAAAGITDLVERAKG